MISKHPWAARNRRIVRWARLAAALSAAAFFTAKGSAQESDELIGLINAYRASPHVCEGKRTAPAGPLAANPVAADAQPSSVDALQKLKSAGYPAARVETITISGTPDPAATMTFIERRYCRALSNQQWSEIGVSRDGETWNIVLVQPLLSSDLGDWRAAGKEVLKLTNAARAESRPCGNRKFPAAPPLEWNEKLAATALAHSRDMADRNYFSHLGRHGEAGDRARRAGYDWRIVGENIADGQGWPQHAVASWLASPGHCANLMRPDFTDMGAAYATNPESEATIYWTQVFGAPR